MYSKLMGNLGRMKHLRLRPDLLHGHVRKWGNEATFLSLASSVRSSTVQASSRRAWVYSTLTRAVVHIATISQLLMKLTAI